MCAIFVLSQNIVSKMSPVSNNASLLFCLNGNVFSLSVFCFQKTITIYIVPLYERFYLISFYSIFSVKILHGDNDKHIISIVYKL